MKKLALSLTIYALVFLQGLWVGSGKWTIWDAIAFDAFGFGAVFSIALYAVRKEERSATQVRRRNSGLLVDRAPGDKS